MSVRARGWDAKQWCVEVEDHGIGISDQDLNRLFSTFVQLSAGSTKAYGGTGLGLALVRKIARAQGGMCKCEASSTSDRSSRWSCRACWLQQLLSSRPMPQNRQESAATADAK